MARRFWVKLRNESIPALYTPIVVSLASSNLKLDTFRHYISHDASPKYELEEECTDDDDAKVSISQLMKNVLEELKLHNSFVQTISEMVQSKILVGTNLISAQDLQNWLFGIRAGMHTVEDSRVMIQF